MLCGWLRLRLPARVRRRKRLLHHSRVRDDGRNERFRRGDAAVDVSDALSRLGKQQVTQAHPRRRNRHGLLSRRQTCPRRRCRCRCCSPLHSGHIPGDSRAHASESKFENAHVQSFACLSHRGRGGFFCRLLHSPIMSITKRFRYVTNEWTHENSRSNPLPSSQPHFNFGFENPLRAQGGEWVGRCARWVFVVSSTSLSRWPRDCI